MFPETFLWGAAASSHQVEGDNANNDWWLWEQKGRVKTPSGEAARHYALFDQDFCLAQRLGHNAHRFSIEWSRVEPEAGRFDQEAIEHYRQVVRSLRDKSIEPVVTLHHFTNPLWFHDRGGWLNPNSRRWFGRYVEKAVAALGDGVRYWVTVNEPVVLVFYGYLTGQWPPGKKSPRQAWQALGNLAAAHKLAHKKIHDTYNEHRLGEPMAGIAKNLRPFEVCPKTPAVFCRAGARLRHYFFNLYFLDKIRDAMDFVGVNYYEREFVSNDRSCPRRLWGGDCRHVHDHAEHLNQMGWASYPEGLAEALGWMKRYRKPVLITENGTAEQDDLWRWRFIAGHLKQVEKAIAKGAPVIGYLYWSLLDNFEWHRGFGPRFGLIEVDDKTFERRVRPSALLLKEVIQTRKLPQSVP